MKIKLDLTKKEIKTLYNSLTALQLCMEDGTSFTYQDTQAWDRLNKKIINAVAQSKRRVSLKHTFNGKN